jgi:hypothetical protein
MQSTVGAREALDGGHRAVFGLAGQSEARHDPAAVDMHGARSALPVIAPFLDAGQADAFAKDVQKARTGVQEAQIMAHAIDLKDQVAFGRSRGRR